MKGRIGCVVAEVLLGISLFGEIEIIVLLLPLLCLGILT